MLCNRSNREGDSRKPATLASFSRHRFVREGGIDLVLQLLHLPELQYFAMSALVVLVGSLGSTAHNEVRHPSATLDSLQRSSLLDSLLPLLHPGNPGVIQGRCCGVLTHLLKLEQRAQVTPVELMPSEWDVRAMQMVCTYQDVMCQ